MHGAHLIITEGFKNVHISYVEIFNAGQPRLSRHPVNYHNAGYVGEIGRYEDPSSIESLSIYDSFRTEFKKRIPFRNAFYKNSFYSFLINSNLLNPWDTQIS